MMRFDLLNLHRKSIIRIFKVFIKKPQKFIFLLPSFIESMISMSNISHIKIEGIIGNIKIKGLLIIYFATFLIWIKDESNSLDKTMTTLDNYLIRAENFLSILQR